MFHRGSSGAHRGGGADETVLDLPLWVWCRSCCTARSTLGQPPPGVTRELAGLNAGAISRRRTRPLRPVHISLLSTFAIPNAPIYEAQLATISSGPTRAHQQRPHELDRLRRRAALSLWTSTSTSWFNCRLPSSERRADRRARVRHGGASRAQGPRGASRHRGCVAAAGSGQSTDPDLVGSSVETGRTRAR